MLERGRTEGPNYSYPRTGRFRHIDASAERDQDDDVEDADSGRRSNYSRFPLPPAPPAAAMRRSIPSRCILASPTMSWARAHAAYRAPITRNAEAIRMPYTGAGASATAVYLIELDCDLAPQPGGRRSLAKRAD